MIDWSSSMRQTFEFYEVDPLSWKDRKPLTTVKSCTISRDLDAETLGSATFDIVESVGECYIRVYMVVTQDDDKEKIPLGTFLVQTPSSTFDGKTRNVSMDAYTPLLELKENKPPIGYYIPKERDVMQTAVTLLKNHARAKVVGWPENQPSTLLNYHFIADTEDTWLSFISDLITAAYTSTCYSVEKVSESVYKRGLKLDNNLTNGEKLDGITTTTKEQVYKSADGDFYCVINNDTKYKLNIDELGQITFTFDRDIDGSTPVWTYSDDNSSILYSEMSMDHDLYGVPNVVEVLYSDDTNRFYSRVENNNPDSPTSITNRGREILHRVTNPEIYGTPSQERVDAYAKNLLKELSSIEYKISYTHGYCPVKTGDCVRINYSRAGLINIKAKVVSQSITCEAGCPVSETAIFTANLME